MLFYGQLQGIPLGERRTRVAYRADRPSSRLVLQQETEESTVEIMWRSEGQVRYIKVLYCSPNVGPGHLGYVDVHRIGKDLQAVFVLEFVEEIAAILTAAERDDAVELGLAAAFFQSSFQIELPCAARSVDGGLIGTRTAAGRTNAALVDARIGRRCREKTFLTVIHDDASFFR